jgi:hypothetical protein
MTHGIEKRRCRRFEIPGAAVKFKKRGLLVHWRSYSETYPTLNISKGGLSFICNKKLSKGTKLLVQLFISDKTPLNIISIVRRQEQTLGSERRITAIEFMPFVNRHGLNNIETLDVLRKLDQKYGGNS